MAGATSERVMIHHALGRPTPVEFTDDPRIVGRVRRLAALSAVMLGLIWVLAVATLETPFLVNATLLAGWVLMPLTLLASLATLAARYWLVLPSTLVSLGLLAVVVGWLPDDPVAAAGWVLMLAGVVLGGAMGLWLWFRVLPVPKALDDPVWPGRWALIGVHVALVLLGAFLVIAAALAA